MLTYMALNKILIPKYRNTIDYFMCISLVSCDHTNITY